MLTPPLGIFGGTFDPIHKGHIYPIKEAASITNIKSIAVIPCYVPTHKGAAAVSSQHRLNMIELVCAEHPIFYSDSRDINRGLPTYSVDTLKELRTECPLTPLCFFIGTDSLKSLANWYQWQEILSLCHFIVCNRHSNEAEYLNQTAQQPLLQQQDLHPVLQKNITDNLEDLHNKLAGHIYIANTQPYTMSSNQVRKQLKMQKNVEDLLPSSVLTYIHQHKLYQLSNDLC